MRTPNTFAAKLRKLSANTKDKLDSIQFQMDENQVKIYGDQIIALRRFDYVKITLSQDQSSLSPDGSKIEFFEQEFQSLNTSISVCVTESGQIITVTLSTDNRRVFDELIKRNLRDQVLNLEFTEGNNPYSQ